MTQRVFHFRGATLALQDYNFRWFMLARILATATIQMRNVGSGWLIYHLTDSALALGWVAAAKGLTILITSPLGGVFTDRFEKRTILVWTRVVWTLSAFAVALLIYFDVIRVWHMVLVYIVDGVVIAFMMPAQDTIISDLVDRKTLLNAVSLNFVSQGLMGIFGALAAGYLIESAGPAGVYLGMGLLFSMVTFALLKLPKGGIVSDTQPVTLAQVYGRLVEGLRHVWHSSTLLTLILMGVTFGFFTQSYRTFLPAFARDDLFLSAVGLGILTAAVDAGALTNSLVATLLGDSAHKGKLYLGSGILGGVCLILLANFQLSPAPFVLMFLIGALGNMIQVMNMTLLQSHCDLNMRGRVFSISYLLRGLAPVWLVAAGTLAEWWGVPLVFTVMGVVLVAIYLAIAAFRPGIWRLR
ncbi:MAG: MFS transporter [Chloroflexi bacterium]|nr:MAG: MFS transporter [Chloroflexota bacterium]